MLIKAENLDDAMGAVMRRLFRRGERIRAGKGAARELTCVLVQISQPRARFSRTEERGILFSLLGETLWYLSGSDDLNHISYYISKYRDFIGAPPDAVSAPGAYGPRLFYGGEASQMLQLLKILKKKIARSDSSDTRQAVAQIFSKEDIQKENGDVPCTLTMQFLPRSGKLHLSVSMRSNDIYRGFPADIFAFTFIQEIFARSLGLDLGTYSHFVGSLHLYENDEERVRDYLNEGFQTPMSMPPMPEGDPWPSIQWLLRFEQSMRCGSIEPSADDIDAYWLDLARLLRIKALRERNEINLRQIVRIKKEMSSEVYDAFIRGRQIALLRHLEDQLVLPGILDNDHNQRKQ